MIKKPKITFRLYNQMHSSYFNLIKGDDETKQTKGLGIVLSKSEIALRAFLKMPKIKDAKINLDKYDAVIVNCELVSKTDIKQRLDVLIRFFEKNVLKKTIIIEAKSSNKNISFLSAKSQLEGYLDNRFQELDNVKENDLIKVVLTKYSGVSTDGDTISLAWDDIYTMLYQNRNQDELINDYFNFLTKINGTMKFYEKEVYSIPSAEWSSNAIEKLKIYECPNSGRYLIKQKPLYITFRKSGGGEMSKLYKIDDIIIFNPRNDYKVFLNSDDYTDEIKQKIENYVNYMRENNFWTEEILPDEEKQFFILSENDNIELKNNPKPEKNNSFRAYYKLSDLLTNNIVGSKEEIEETE